MDAIINNSGIDIEDETKPFSERLGYQSKDLILHYDAINNAGIKKHDDSMTVWKDLSGNDNDGELIGSKWESKCLVLNGAGDGVYLGNKMTDLFKSSNTIELTLMFHESNARDIIIGNYSVSNNINYEKYSSNDTKIYFKNGSLDSNSDANVLDINEYITLTYRVDKENNKLEIFKNANKVYEVTNNIIGSYNYDWTQVYIGKDSRSDSTCLKGEIASVRIYNNKLNDEAIKKNYQADNERYIKMPESIELGYVKEKMFAHYDGIENNLRGHTTSKTKWQDISGNHRDLNANTNLSSTFYWENNAMVKSQAGNYHFKSDIIPELINLQDNMTLELAIEPKATGTSSSRDIATVISRNSEPWCGAGVELAEGKLAVYANLNSSNPYLYYDKFELDKPIYVSMTMKKNESGTGKVTMYINGQEYTSTEVNMDGFKISSETYSRIGLFDFIPNYYGGDNSYIGKIYSVRIYEKALSSTEIQKNYQIDKNRFSM